MKKLNNKGVTLVELIVSFALVSVAIIYFYQTLFTVKKLYTKSQKETQAFVDKTYALRILDAYIENYKDPDPKYNDSYIVAVDFLLIYEALDDSVLTTKFGQFASEWVNNFKNSLKELTEENYSKYKNFDGVSYEVIKVGNKFILSFTITLKNSEKVVLYKS